jgi:2-polyprenyl-6-hydroxyphenyl methylase/3-demethylubiquinone-9 3-methyltransferase
MERDERDLESHFAFGENWSQYSRVVTDAHLDAAVTELVRLLGRDDLHGVRFLDIGCGSGLHSVAAARLGATVTAVDIDPASVRTTEEIAQRFGVADRITTSVASVFELDPADGRYDIVYSWGVLHHTGDMWEAIRRAAALVDNVDSAELVLALYRRTRLCRFWTVEKRLYSRAPRAVQLPVRAIYTLLLDAARLAKGTTPWRYRADYLKQRGMQVKYDVHDWLGGYPYQSATPGEVGRYVTTLGFEQVNAFTRGAPEEVVLVPGCDEYRFARTNTAT